MPCRRLHLVDFLTGFSMFRDAHKMVASILQSLEENFN